MDILIGWEAYETEYKGEKITMELLPLKVDEYALLSPHMRKYDSNDRESATKNALEMQGKALPILTTNVRNLKGITINGQAPTPEQIATEMPLSMLAQKIIQELILRSLLTEDERKNSVLPSDDSQTAENQT